MKLNVALVALLLVVGSASGFSTTAAPALSRSFGIARATTTQLHGVAGGNQQQQQQQQQQQPPKYKQNYFYKLNKETGAVRVNGNSFDDTRAASEQMDADLKASQAAGEQAMNRLNALQDRFKAKEQEQIVLKATMTNEMKQQKKEYTQQVNDMGMEATHVKLEAHKEKMQVVDEFKARETALQTEMADLRAMLLQEKENIEANQRETGQILETRVQLEASLAELQGKYDNDSREWQQKLAAEEAAHKQDFFRLTAELAAHNKNLEEYQRTSKELESQLTAEQDAHNRDVKQYEQMSKELERKLTAELEAHKKDLKDLEAEKEARIRDVMRYEQASQELAAKLEAEKEAHDRDLGVLTTEQEKYQRELADYQEKLNKAQEMTSSILKNRIALQQESNDLETMLTAEQKAHDEDLLNSQRMLTELRQEIFDMGKEQDVLKRNKEQTDTLYQKLNTAQEMTNRILQKRVEIDGELTTLQRKYENDQKAWKTQMEREIAAQKKEADAAKAELAAMKEKEAKREAELNDVGTLVGKTFKVMFGQKD